GRLDPVLVLDALGLDGLVGGLARAVVAHVARPVVAALALASAEAGDRGGREQRGEDPVAARLADHGEDAPKLSARPGIRHQGAAAVVAPAWPRRTGSLASFAAPRPADLVAQLRELVAEAAADQRPQPLDVAARQRLLLALEVEHDRLAMAVTLEAEQVHALLVQVSVAVGHIAARAQDQTDAKALDLVAAADQAVVAAPQRGRGPLVVVLDPVDPAKR